MKYRVRFETTHRELHKKVWDEIRQICTEYSIPLTADYKDSTNITQINLKAKIGAKQKLNRDNKDGSKPIKL